MKHMSIRKIYRDVSGLVGAHDQISPLFVNSSAVRRDSLDPFAIGVLQNILSDLERNEIDLLRERFLI